MILDYCYICNKPINRNKYICDSCISRLSAANLGNYYHRCPICGFPLLVDDYNCPECNYRNGLYLFSVYDYRSYFAMKLLHKYKFENYIQLSKYFALVLNNYIKSKSFDYVVPIPCSLSSLKNRGWDQMSQIVKNLDISSKLMIVRNDLYKEDVEQKSLNRIDRISSSKNKYSLVNEEVEKTSKILIVDDVVTTGSTLLACYNLFKEFGYNNVEAFTFYIQL